jgi:hypothetical protein
MGHFAKVLGGQVVNVIAAEPEFFETFVDSSPGEWIQTSYNTRNGIHYGPDGEPDDGVALRGNFAGIGYVYDTEHDVFYPPSPYPSWVINTTTWDWEAPIPKPDEEKPYIWDEETQTWIEVPPLPTI